MTAMFRVPRSRGALSGALLVLLGLWGALAPLAGPYFHFAFAPDKAWTLTSGRVWLQIVPGCAVILGGLTTLSSANRAFAALGAWLGALGGAWFAVGVPLSALWAGKGHAQLGQAVGDTTRQVAEQVALLYGLGAVVVFIAALALGRLAVVGVKDARLAEEEEAYAEDAPAPGPSQDRSEPLPATPPVARTEQVPATPPEPMAPRTVGSADVKVAGAPETEETRTTRRPGANA
jgi:hypothetical protein